MEAGTDGVIRVLGAGEVDALLTSAESEVIERVAEAYRSHERGETSLPHSIFLRFPGDDTNRIIGLPAFLDGPTPTAGMKWIASFPGNLERGMSRASAAMILNSCDTGRPEAFLEASIISARRTAASAALAARELTAGGPAVAEAGLIGCGLINLETARFLRTALPSVERFVVFDLADERARRFTEVLMERFPGVTAEVAGSMEEVLGRCRLTAFATTAIRPHVDDLSVCPAGATILHTSLRDLTANAILSADNVVDDVDHVNREGTSIDLACRETGSTDFVRCTLGRLLEGGAPAKRDPEAVTVFSPFGLGILDLAVARFALDRAVEERRGTVLENFLPVADPLARSDR